MNPGALCLRHAVEFVMVFGHRANLRLASEVY